MGHDIARLIRIRYASTCIACGVRLAAGANAWWDPSERHITCEGCHGQARKEAPPAFMPGASAQRTAEKRAAQDRAEWRNAGLLKKAAIVWRGEQSKARSWSQGAEGERIIGSLLSRLQMAGLIFAIHDVRIPRTSANVDHIAVAPSGIHIIDAKHYRDKLVEVVDRGNLLKRNVQLRVEKRNRTHLVDKLTKQILFVDSMTRDAALPTPVTAVLCFVHSRWGPFTKEYVLHGVHIVPPARLERLLGRPGPLDANKVARIGELLHARFRPA